MAPARASTPWRSALAPGPGQLATSEVQELAHWCHGVIGAQLIAIDAPCRWSGDGRARPCERELNAAGIRCFASPSRTVAVSHPSNYYGWMLQGEALYRELEISHPLLSGLPPPRLPASAPACFETFPHAITWHLRGGSADARQKRPQRRALLEQAGIDTAPLTSTVRPPLATAQAIGLPQAAITAIQQVRAGYPEVEAAILYGSRARGTARTDSDLDGLSPRERVSSRLQ